MNWIPVSDIVLNLSNPRYIREARFLPLVKSVAQFPLMLKKRGCVVDASKMLLAGNMRWRAILHIIDMPEAELKAMVTDGDPTKKQATLELWTQVRAQRAVPSDWIVDGSDMTPEEAARFIIVDNVGFGQWNWDILGNEWETEKLTEWGLEIPGFDGPPREEEAEHRPWVPDCLFPSNNTYEIPTLNPDMQAGFITNPVTLWGVDKRTRKIDGGTILFYVDDYRFTALWDDPAAIQHTGCAAIVEPNLSLYDTMPVSYGLHLIFKKRWLSRWLQEVGVKVFVDLNVSVKFEKYNLLGVPEGWNAFCTRGYTDRIKYLEREITLAREVSGLKDPNMIVYGGGQNIREVVAKNNLTYLETFRNFDS